MSERYIVGLEADHTILTGLRETRHSIRFVYDRVEKSIAALDVRFHLKWRPAPPDIQQRLLDRLRDTDLSVIRLAEFGHVYEADQIPAWA